MKRMRRLFLLLISMTVYVAGISELSAAGTPAESVRSTVDAVINTLKDQHFSQPGKKQERREKMRALINDRFDFEEMAQRSLARHWQPRTSAEKKEFVEVFSDLIESSYIGKIELYTDEKITYDRETLKGDGKYSVVSTTVITKNVNIPIEYKLILKNNKWWVYDVTIEGVSFISTYREQYNKIIVKESFDGLMKKMRSKLEEIKTLEEQDSAKS
ncbi:MAG: ABC transporter substrate-binding protein [Nitrospiraceae bacterium]|nr:MAG: ABC transporter substrate-binding protein [Nitrospiraceae bacterium]